MGRTHGLTAVLAIGLLMACGDDGDSGPGGNDQAIGNADCSDPAANPYAEIECVTSFMGDCFLPTGACSGVVDTVSLGKTTLEWESGESVEATPFYDFSGIDFNDPSSAADAARKNSGADVVINGKGGNTCATGMSRLEQTTPEGKSCASYTVYRNNSGQTLTYCFDEGGNGTVTCSSNGMSYEVKGGDKASNCQSGSTAAGQCDIEVKMANPGDFMAGLPGLSQ